MHGTSVLQLASVPSGGSGPSAGAGMERHASRLAAPVLAAAAGVPAPQQG